MVHVDLDALLVDLTFPRGDYTVCSDPFQVEKAEATNLNRTLHTQKKKKKKKQMLNNCRRNACHVTHMHIMYRCIKLKACSFQIIEFRCNR